MSENNEVKDLESLDSNETAVVPDSEKRGLNPKLPRHARPQDSDVDKVIDNSYY